MKLQVIENKLYNENGDEVGVRFSCYNHSNDQKKIDSIMDSLKQYADLMYQGRGILYSTFCSIVVMTDIEKLETNTRVINQDVIIE